MTEFLKIKSLLHNLNLPTNTVLRGYFPKFPYESTKINNKKKCDQFSIWANKQNDHPQHFKIEMDTNSLNVVIKFTNESTNRGFDNHKLLDKDVMQNPKYFYIKKGFERKYDCNNLNDMQDLRKLIFGVKTNSGKNNQIIPDFNKIEFQDLNLMDLIPQLTQSVIIQAAPLDVITPFGDNLRETKIKKGHCLVQEGKVNITGYHQAQKEHQLLSKDNCLAPKVQTQHEKISTEMDFLKPILSVNSFISKFIK